MRKTSVTDIVVGFALGLVVALLILRSQYESMPPLSYFTPVPLVALAAVEFVLARRIRGAVGHDPETKLIPAIAVARSAALGKASALTAGIVLGASVALLLRVGSELSTVTAAQHDAIVAVLTLIAAASLLAAGLVLEHSALIPPD